MNKILTLSNGQHILFGMVLSHMTNNLNIDFPKNNLEKLAEFIIEIDSPEANNYDLTYSESIEEYLENSFEISTQVWEKYEEVFLAISND